VTVGEAIRFSTEQLAARGIPDARVEAEWLMAHLLSAPRTLLFMKSGLPLDPPIERALHGFLERRFRREPLQHILGSVNFCGIELTVNEDALIPRPETELLAERAWCLANNLAGDAPRILDFGTGTGCLAIAIQLRARQAEVHALDCSPGALALARRNALEHDLHDIRFHEGDGFNALPEPMEFDLIVSNPPYIPSADIRHLQPEVRDYDPRIALDGDEDGLAFYRLFANEAARWLKPGGTLLCEFGDGQEADIPLLFADDIWTDRHIYPDLNDSPRFFKADKAGPAS